MVRWTITTVIGNLSVFSAKSKAPEHRRTPRCQRGFEFSNHSTVSNPVLECIRLFFDGPQTRLEVANAGQFEFNTSAAWYGPDSPSPSVSTVGSSIAPLIDKP
jgi:hypothetical protein